MGSDAWRWPGGGMRAHAVDTVSGYYYLWQRHFDPRIPKTRWQRFWVACHGTGVKWSILVGMVVQILCVLDCVMARTSVLEAGPAIRFTFGIYSCTWGVYVYAFKRAEMLGTVSRLLAVARDLEAALDGRHSHIQATLRVAARQSMRYLRGMELWSLFIFVTVIPPAIINHQPANPAWPPPTTDTAFYALLSLHLLSTVFLPVGYFPGTAMLFGLQNCAAALLRGVGQRLELAATEDEVYEIVALSSRLNKALSMLDRVYHVEYMHLLASTLVMPLMATYEVINGHIDPFLYSVGPLNVIIFIPLCFAGQGVESAGRDMCDLAYAGRWEDEGVRCRLLRLQVMLRAVRPARCTSRELGAVNLNLCQNALRKWFSFLNFMINTQRPG